MTTLIVRAGTYRDENYQRVIRLIDEIWGMVGAPPETEIVKKEMSPKWLSAMNRMYAGHYFRYWAAWDVFRVTPAEWLVIMDVDVIPTERGAPAKLTSFLLSLPENVGLVTRQPIGGAAKFVKENYFNPSEGILAVRKDYVPTLMLSQIHYHFSIASKRSSKTTHDYILVNEGQLTSHLPAAKIAYFPSEICRIYTTAEAIPNTSTAFIHPAGDITHPNFVDCVVSLLSEYIKGVR